MFCNAEKCTMKCPAYIGLDFGETNCEIINAMLKSEEAKKKAYRSMKVYWDNT